jgi:uncharacterized membrane protein
MSLPEDPAARVARAEAIWRTAFRWGLAITALQAAVAAYYAYQVWPLPRVPMHWNIKGEVDRYGKGRQDALLFLLLPCISLMVTALIRFVTRAGPRLEGMAATPRLLAAVFIFVPLLFTGVIAMIGSMTLSNAPFAASAWKIRAVLVGAGLLVGVLGNFMGKTQRNWYIGVRTPWSLSSDAAWQKSNRLAGRLMVITGAVAVLLALFGPPVSAAIALGLGSAIMGVSAVYVSWAVWRNDPNRTA